MTNTTGDGTGIDSNNDALGGLNVSAQAGQG